MLYIFVSKIDLEHIYLQGIFSKNWSVSQAVWSVVLISYFGLKRFYACVFEYLCLCICLCNWRGYVYVYMCRIIYVSVCICVYVCVMCQKMLKLQTICNFSSFWSITHIHTFTHPYKNTQIFNHTCIESF